MRRLWMLATLGVLIACGGEEDAPETPCEGETEEELCLAAAAGCGSVEVRDRCGVTRTVACGGCDGGFLCMENQCIAGTEGCLLVPEEGVCEDVFTVERCLVKAEGEVTVRELCGRGEICVDAEGGARCEALGEGCAEGIAYCARDVLRTCEKGKFTETRCPHGCTSGGRGAYCREAPDIEVTWVRSRILYEHRVPNDEMTGLEVENRPAAGLMVSSMRGGTVIDQTVVGEDGTFELFAPSELGETDVLYFAAVEYLMGEGSTRFGVVDPDLPPGDHSVSDSPGPNSSYWSWMFRVPDDDVPLLVTEKVGSAAIQIFQGVRRTVRHVAGFRGLAQLGLSAYYKPGVDYDCGACFIPWQGFGLLFFSGGSFQTGVLDSVILHESGHHAFYALGPYHVEAGGHCLGVPAPPAQALTEGHATWYGADRRKSPREFRIQQGTFFTWDIERMEPASLMAPPLRSEGLLQDMNESWVTSMLWHLAKDLGSSRPLHAALSAPEMQAPFSSGYTGKTWIQVDQNCRPVDPQDTGLPAPVLADLLDAWVCSGLPVEPIQSYIEPHYPYDPTAPTCK